MIDREQLFPGAIFKAKNLDGDYEVAIIETIGMMDVWALGADRKGRWLQIKSLEPALLGDGLMERLGFQKDGDGNFFSPLKFDELMAYRVEAGYVLYRPSLTAYDLMSVMYVHELQRAFLLFHGRLLKPTEK